MKRTAQKLLIRAFVTAANAVMITDRYGHIVWVNKALCRLSGFNEDELLGKTPNILRSGVQSAAFYQVLWETILAGQPWQGELVERSKDGTLFTVNQIITPLFDDEGAITHFIAIQHDMTSQGNEREKIKHLAYHDSLTGLANRQYFLDMLASAIDAAAKQHKMLAVMFLDLDHFKSVNDNLGHAIGDKLLIAVAGRLLGAVRKSDLVARLGGDEFTVLVTDLADINDVKAIANQLVTAISQPFVFDQLQVLTHPSIGISLYPRDGSSADELLAKADAEMYRVKAQGGSGWRLDT
ncbi:diguanylate cyclase domain-containing protein [Chitinimonas sp. PSY-7]|uniref:diguanylate cyclase domain-containing protein n=1 Tax=Chitinimonas sp. PSY-7 TaxID=3459088 RepID=UPI00403FE33E